MFVRHQRAGVIRETDGGVNVSERVVEVIGQSPVTERERPTEGALSLVETSERTRVEFGPRLRRERERRGLTLADIAASTKIKTSLLASLEHSDVSQWPAGLFRRAFIREYAAAIGLPPESIVAEFVRLFPDGGEAGSGGDSGALTLGHSSLRLTLATDGSAWVRAAGRRVVTGLLDLVLILGATSLIALVGGFAVWPTLALIALGYFTLSHACLGQTAGIWCLGRLGRRRGSVPSRHSHAGGLRLIPGPSPLQARGAK